jgi:hypothetical protein
MTWTEVMMGDMFAAVVGIIIMFQRGGMNEAIIASGWMPPAG